MFAAVGVPCPAQTPSPATPPAFSQPADSEIANPESSESLPPANSSERVSQLFRMGPPESLGPPTPDLNPAWQKQEQERSEWSLQTPEEIMGLQTPRQMFGLPDEDENLSPEERYLHRLDVAKASAADSALSKAGGPGHDFSLRFDRADAVDSKQVPSGQDNSSAFSRMFKEDGPSPFGGANSPLFGAKPTAAVSDAQTAKDQLDQAAEMARFRSLIGEAPSTPDATSTQPQTQAQLQSGLPPQTPFELDEFGRTAASQTVDLSKPAGVTLPPEIVGYYTEAPPKPKKPSWEPQAPPWLSGGSLNPDKPPVRKFY